MSFLISPPPSSKNKGSERPTALLPVLGVDQGPRCGGTGRAVRLRGMRFPVTLVELWLLRWKPCWRWRKVDSRVVDLACARDNKKKLRVQCGFLAHQRRVIFENCVAEFLQTITGPRGQCFMQEAMTTLFKLYPELNVRFCVNDLKLHLARIR